MQKKLQQSQKGDIASKRTEKIEIINTLKTIDTEIRALSADVTKRVSVQLHYTGEYQYLEHG